MTPTTPVTTLPFVGPKYAKLLEKLGIKTAADLLYHLPKRYIDLSQITPIDQLLEDELQVVKATVTQIKKVRIRGGRVMITAQVMDHTGRLQLTWFNQPYMEKSLQEGSVYRFAGEVSYKYNQWQMISPQVELASKPPVHTGRLVPIYAQTAGVSSKWLRARLAPLMSKTGDITPEFLPDEVIKRQQLNHLPQAIRHLHAPESLTQANQAKYRLAFDELLLLQLAAMQRKSNWQAGRQAAKLAIQDDALEKIMSQLPFILTDAQMKAIQDIRANIASSTPMNRLLEGDVGSGKTIVAFIAALIAVANDYQVALMAPTSVLAQQHYQSFQSLLEKFTNSQGLDIFKSGTPTLSLRTSKSKMAPADITVGTHALIADGVDFDKLGLVIIDEQHRFGVEQRATLMAKAKQAVHLLSMTATPIPRTLALTAYGDLSLSILDQMPQGRLPIKTHIVPDRKRQDMYGFIAKALDRGEQAYVICPLVEESDNIQSVRDATSEYQRLQTIFPNHKLALLHGRLKPTEKDQILADFKDHKFDLLVATPVVEVGIDVPNATMLLIEGAERFGLAQLHQLRGRVGRGSIQSYCFLLSDSTQAEDVQRLQHLEHEHSGIRLAEIDLQTRGPGEVYGTRQSGIPELKAADLQDVELIEKAQQEAQHLFATNSLQNHPALAEKLAETNKRVEMN